MKKNIEGLSLALVVLTFVVLGCGLLGGAVSNDQISDDLIAKGEVTKGPSTFDFAGQYSSHCFKVDKTNVTGDKAEITITIAGDEVTTGANSVNVLKGELTLTYKKDAGKWKLENIEPTTFDTKMVSTQDAVSKFAPAAKPLCAVYQRPYNSKKEKRNK